jgi:hypothetical protein
LGLTLLRTATLKSITGCNNNPEKLNNLIKILKNSKYDTNIVLCIEKMCSWDESRRPMLVMFKEHF